MISATLLTCVSPACTSPSCVTAAADTQIDQPLEVSMNGVDFTSVGIHWRYYDMRHVFVSHLTPGGGPTRGGTQVRVSGYSFRDLTSGVEGVTRQGIRCKFGAMPMVDAVRHRAFDATCAAPVDATNYTNGSTPLAPGAPGAAGGEAAAAAAAAAWQRGLLTLSDRSRRRSC